MLRRNHNIYFKIAMSCVKFVEKPQGIFVILFIILQNLYEHVLFTRIVYKSKDKRMQYHIYT
jgi:hypothetical protein